MNATRDASLKIICHELVPWRSDCVASVVPFGGGSLKGRKWNVNRDSPFQMFNDHFHLEFFCCCRFFFQFDFDENISLHEMKRWKRIYRWFRHSFLRKPIFLPLTKLMRMFGSNVAHSILDIIQNVHFGFRFSICCIFQMVWIGFYWISLKKIRAKWINVEHLINLQVKWKFPFDLDSHWKLMLNNEQHDFWKRVKREKFPFEI